jgi:ribosome-binding factor A
MSRRTERLASTIRQELAQVILRELNDPRISGLPSITRVKVSDDLSIADVYVTVMGTPGHQRAALNALRHSAGLMRTRLTKSLSIRQTPFIRFHLDEQAKKEIEILGLLHKISEENAETDRLKAQQAAEGGQDSQGQSPEPGDYDAGP